MLLSFKKLKEKYKLDKKDTFLKGTYFGLLLFCLTALSIGAFYFRTGISPWLQVLTYLIAGTIAFSIFRWLGAFAHSLFKRISGKLIALIVACLATFWLAGEMRFNWPGAIYNKSLIIGMLAMSFVFGGIFSAINKRSGKGLYLSISLVGLAMIYFALRPILSSGKDPFMVEADTYRTALNITEGLKNPGIKGDFEVEYFTYGSGTDSRRPAYGAEVKYTTNTVNALPLLPEWTGKRKKWREKYWEFGIDKAPLNGRVWMPTSGEQLPIILIVHGNHGMEHHSDPGYQYLGELLASRGFITVSVDENFINGTWSGDFRGKEMPARAWLLLKHLEQWRNWSNDQNSALYQKADTDNVILIGHSRGGEAVSIAAAYNELDHFPDDASVNFDFNFGIKGLVAIAPTDARYFRRIQLKNINYLSLQGTYDADEASFFGLRQYQRVQFTDTSDHFKAGVLIHKANHGQFNSIWGSRDFGEPFGWFLNTGALISGEEQRQAAKVFISAFAERTFNKAPFDPIFEHPLQANEWLPNTVMLGNYQNSKTKFILDYENDIDLASDQNMTIAANDFLIWREEDLKMRGGDTQGTNAAILGWNSDSIAKPVYEITLHDSIRIDTYDQLVMSLGRANDPILSLEGNEPIDFRLQLITAMDTIDLPSLSAVKKPAPLLNVEYMKLPALNGSFGNKWELNMETAALPLNIITDNDIWLKKLRIIFDQSPKGVIALDNIGFRKVTHSEAMLPD